MSGRVPHSGGNTPPRLSGPVGAILQFGPGFWRSLCLAVTFVLLASLAHGSSVTQTDTPGTLPVAIASAPAGDPCGSQDGAFHDHALCCSSVSCPVFVPVDAVFELALDVRAKTTAGSDLNFSSHAPPALFHPPKLLVIA